LIVSILYSISLYGPTWTYNLKPVVTLKGIVMFRTFGRQAATLAESAGEGGGGVRRRVSLRDAWDRACHPQNGLRKTRLAITEIGFKKPRPDVSCQCGLFCEVSVMINVGVRVKVLVGFKTGKVGTIIKRDSQQWHRGSISGGGELYTVMFDDGETIPYSREALEEYLERNI
jgi:hypothetical protein